MKHFKTWVLIVLSYMFTFIPPVIAAYFFLAVEKVEEMGKGGAFYYTIISIVGIVMIITLTKAVNNMRANLFKSIFKIALKVSILLGAVGMIKYIDFNMVNLIYFFYVSLGGVVIGSLLEIIAVWFYSDYIREVGVF